MKLSHVLEAKYLQPRTQKIVGILHYDDRNYNDFFEQEGIVIRFRIEKEDVHPGDFNSRILKVQTIYGKESWLAKKIGILPDTEAYYQHDKHGRALSGWKMGPGRHCPWMLEESK